MKKSMVSKSTLMCLMRIFSKVFEVFPWIPVRSKFKMFFVRDNVTGLHSILFDETRKLDVHITTITYQRKCYPAIKY